MSHEAPKTQKTTTLSMEGKRKRKYKELHAEFKLEEMEEKVERLEKELSDLKKVLEKHLNDMGCYIVKSLAAHHSIYVGDQTLNYIQQITNNGLPIVSLKL